MAVLILLLIGGAFIVAAVIGFERAKKNRERAAEVRTRLSSTYGSDEIYVSAIDGSLAAISFDRKKVVLGNSLGEREYDFSSIASVEIIENGVTLSQTNRGSQLLGAAVGGLAFGVAGAMVGGLSGSARSHARLLDLAIKITVDDRVEPVHIIRFFKSPLDKGVDPNGALASPARAAAERVHAHLLNAMRNENIAHAKPVSVGSSVDDLHKLFEMKQAGALTDDEFEREKKKLLQADSTVTSEETLPLPSSFSLIIASVPPPRDAIYIIKEIRALRPELSLREVMNLVQRAPAPIIRGVSAEQAELAKGRLVAAGANAQILGD